MADVLNMSLDDIIKKSKENKNFGKVRGGYRGRKQQAFKPRNRTAPYGRFSTKRRGYAGGYVGGNAARFQNYPVGDMNSVWTHDLYDEGEESYGGSYGFDNKPLTKLTISNLEHTVTDADIQELFSEFGDILSAKIQYDKSGRSVGIANVLYTNKGSALNAQKRYHGVSLDGRPMQITLAGSNEGSGFRGRRQYGYGNRRGFVNKRRGVGGKGSRTASNARRGGNTFLSTEDLDAQLEEYKQFGY